MRQTIDPWATRNRHRSIAVRVRKGSLKIEMSSLTRKHNLFEHTTEKADSCNLSELILCLCNEHKKCITQSVHTAHSCLNRDHKMSLRSVLSFKWHDLFSSTCCCQQDRQRHHLLLLLLLSSQEKTTQHTMRAGTCKIDKGLKDLKHLRQTWRWQRRKKVKGKPTSKINYSSIERRKFWV